MILDPVRNFAKITVSQGYDEQDLSIALIEFDGDILPDPSSEGAFNLVWWNSTDYPDPADDPNVEIVRCTVKTNDTLTISRAQESTTAATHNTTGKTYSMISTLTKKMMDDISNSMAWVDVRSYASINAAVIAIGSTQTTLLVSNAQTLTASLTIPSTLSLKILKGGSIVKASTYTLIINGPFEAGPYQVFSGFSNGDIYFGYSGGVQIYLEWFGAIGDAIGVTGVGTDNTSSVNQAVASVNCRAEILVRGLYRVVYGDVTSAIYPHALAVVESNTTIRGISKGAGFFHDHIAAYGDTDIPYLFAIWGPVSNIKFQGLRFIGRSDHLINGSTSGTFIGIRTQYHNGTTWSIDPTSMADVPQHITIDDCTFQDGREAIHINGSYALEATQMVYTPFNVNISNIYAQDFEHCISVYKSINKVRIKNILVNYVNRIQRGVAIDYSKNVEIDGFRSMGGTALTSDILIFGGELSGTSFPSEDIQISNISGDRNIRRTNFIVLSDNGVGTAIGTVNRINIVNVNCPTGVINTSGSTATDSIMNINISNFQLGILSLYKFNGIKLSNGTAHSFDIRNGENIILNSVEINASITHPDGVLINANSNCFDLVGVTGFRINNCDLIIADENGMAGLNFISGSFVDINIMNSKVRQYANVATTQRLVNCADGLTVNGFRIINCELDINYIFSAYGTFTNALIKDNICSSSFGALMHKYGDTFTGLIANNYNIGAFTVSTDGTWVLISGIIHDVDGSVKKNIKLNDAGTALDFI